MDLLLIILIILLLFGGGVGYRSYSASGAVPDLVWIIVTIVIVVLVLRALKVM